ncbi:hypothetical protein L1987_46705 [Smallanthus sonchifolius]|uniref:Uncharacterized protein n=1 Tax=Smallanthus sonchifolius TaxID=185202 RepID=A0ACB9G0I8_9ASTR|nr:hypothetical protein L1987_46705 [Smallanthus sonchifolius]
MVQQYSGNMARKLMFGSRYFGKGREDGGPGDEEIEHVDLILTILGYNQAFCVADYFPWLRWITDFDGHEKIIRNAILAARMYQDPLIDDRIQQWKDVLGRNKTTCLTCQSLFCVILIHFGEVQDLFLAASDNVANNIEWAMAEMINEPRIFNKAVHELDFLVGKDRLVQEFDLRNLNYVKACVKETFRLHPVAPFNVTHMTIADSIDRGSSIRS